MEDSEFSNMIFLELRSSVFLTVSPKFFTPLTNKQEDGISKVISFAIYHIDIFPFINKN